MSTTKNKNLSKLIDATRVKRIKNAKPVNHIVLVLDESYSMMRFRSEAIESFKTQIQNIKDEAKKNRQTVSVSAIRFSSTVKEAEQDFNINTYHPDGQTALWDAINEAIKYSDQIRKANDATLIVVITDGEENSSSIDVTGIRKALGNFMSNENCSIVANVPKGTTHRLTHIGVPAFNIREWEVSVDGFNNLTVRNSRGYLGLFSARACGQSMRASTTSYMANMDAVTPKDIEHMNDVSSEFKRWRVTQDDDGTEISKFVYDKGINYCVGNAFYELTKSEKVSANKGILILDKKTGAIYSGDQARRKLGLPIHQDIRIKPGNHGEFTLFIESTSYNRHLVGGTTLLYKII